MKAVNFGAIKEFTDNISREDLYNCYHLTKELIVQDVQPVLK